MLAADRRRRDRGRARRARRRGRDRTRLGALEIGVVHLNVLARAHFEIGAWDEAAAVAERALAPASQLEDVSARVFVWWAATLVPAARGDWGRPTSSRAAPPPSRPTRPTVCVAVGIAHALVARPAAMPRRCCARSPRYPPSSRPPPSTSPASGRGSISTPTHSSRPVGSTTPSGSWPAMSRSRRPAGMPPRSRGSRSCAAGWRRPAASVRRRRWRSRRPRRLGPLERPFDRAHVQLAHGQFLGVSRRRRPPRACSPTAAETFAALGARPALERAERELVASGLRPSRGGGPPHAPGADRRAPGGDRPQQPRSGGRPAAQRQDGRSPPVPGLREARDRLTYAARPSPPLARPLRAGGRNVGIPPTRTASFTFYSWAHCRSE